MNKRLGRQFIFIILIMALIIPGIVLANGAETLNGLSENSNKPHVEHQGETPVFENASVHDPSIIKVDDMYYVYGSHIDAAKSTDLMSWTSFTNGYTTPNNVVYGDLSENLAGSFAWAGEDDADSLGGYAVWAPEIIWNEHYLNEDGTTGAFMMYYSASSTYIRSAIGVAVSKEIEGPFTYVDTIMYSGFYEDEAYDANSTVNKKWTNTNIQDLIDDGTLEGPSDDWFTDDGKYNYNEFTNAIDANLFFDENGKLWMTYGSWAGGIYILEVDPTTGIPKYPGEDGTTSDGRVIDRYFGTKISGGYGRSGEGPYALYDAETDYYYLYVTYGWLGADGGYHMRTFRSENPDGPYEDAAGEPAVLPESLDNGSFGNKPNNLDHADYGNKLMGNFLFDRKVGDPGSGIGYGYVSPGHNSVYTDKETGQRFLVFHARFPETGEMHEVRIHQMFMNKEGWPVVAPYRYGGETLEKVNRQDVIGEYKFINHGKDISPTIKSSVYISLNKNNTISGDVDGTWKTTGHNQAELTIDGDIYDGVFVRQYDPTSERHVMTFTAMSNEGISVWGSKLLNRSSEEVIEAVLNDLNIGDTENVISNLALPTEGTQNTEISWESSDPSVVTAAGEINRPEVGAESVTATLTATIMKDDITKTKSFNVTVLPFKDAGLVAHYTFEGHLIDSTENFSEGTPTGDRIDNTGGNITFAEGKHGHAAEFNGSSGVRLPNGLISSNTYSVSLWVNPDQVTPFTTTFFGARDSNNWVSLLPNGPANGETMVWSGSSRWYDANTGLTITPGEWTHLAFTVDEGTIIVYVDGEEKFTGTDFPNIFTNTSSSFSLGVNWWDTPFKGLMDELHIYEGVLSSNDVANLVDTME
ncbi:LamG-like jellyroll fold domain-containing protein [Bacillus solitudinis]|uniref:LamG-like jellyroll fold domain-containing protein n=1 Tax=Bacillus solitudinis TaxID=2014074 RepID=UPI000C247977|nr:LamG-like jellyroll fold domain-containing protein [Bacillus solitudinis]